MQDFADPKEWCGRKAYREEHCQTIFEFAVLGPQILEGCGFLQTGNPVSVRHERLSDIAKKGSMFFRRPKSPISR